MTYEDKVAYYNRVKFVGLMPSNIALGKFLELCADE